MITKLLSLAWSLGSPIISSRPKIMTWLSVSCMVMVLFNQSVGIVSALSPAQLEIYEEGINYFDVNVNSCSGGSDNASTTPSGSLASLTGSQAISGTFLLGFDASTPKSTIENVFQQYKPAGIFILGTTDASGAGFNSSFFNQLSQDAGHQIVVASDEEGIFHRFSYNFNFPSAQAMGSMSDSEVTSLGQQVGQALTADGVNTDLAPVLDVASDSSDTDAGTAGRAFSDNPDTVAEKAGAFASGLSSAGINPVYKHFPGLGSSNGNTDTQAVTSPPLSQLENRDLIPYKSLVNKNNAAVMLDNAQVPGLTSNGQVASVSSAAVNLLRNKYNFSGLITTDDLTAAGVGMSLPNAVTSSLQAGVNMPLFTYTNNGDLDAAISSVEKNDVNTSSDLQKIDDFLNKNQSTPSTTPSSCSCDSGPSATYSSLSANTYSAGDEYSFLVGKGLSPMVAAAITGNAIWESGGSQTQLTIVTDNPSSVGANGIHQWYEGRLTALKNLANKEGKPWTDLGVQLDYLWLELTDGSGAGADEASVLSAVKSQTDIASATTTFEAKFEVSGDTHSYPYRIAAAEHVLAKFGGQAGAAVGGTVDTSCAGGASTVTGGLTNPFPDGWDPNRLDMGYDGHFTNQIVAPCSGTMIYVDADSNHGANGGWEGAYFVLQCSQSISGLPSNAFYFAEGVSPTVTQNQSVKVGQQIAVPGWTGYTEGPGGIEWGLADPKNPGNALAESGVSGMTDCSAASKTMVLNFAQWLEQNLHVKPPSSTDHAGCA